MVWELRRSADAVQLVALEKAKRCSIPSDAQEVNATCAQKNDKSLTPLILIARAFAVIVHVQSKLEKKSKSGRDLKTLTSQRRSVDRIRRIF